jgi:hypothetical protein
MVPRLKKKFLRKNTEEILHNEKEDLETIQPRDTAYSEM